MKILLFLENGKAFEFKEVQDFDRYENSTWFTYLDEETGKRMSATFKNDKLVGIAKDE